MYDFYYNNKDVNSNIQESGTKKLFVCDCFYFQIVANQFSVIYLTERSAEQPLLENLTFVSKTKVISMCKLIELKEKCIKSLGQHSMQRPGGATLELFFFLDYVSLITASKS